MKIFIINLSHRTDRKAFMGRQLTEFNLEAEFVEAVDGKNLKPEEATLYDEVTARIRNGKVLSPGELGCALSHRKIYEKMTQESISEALILEDDIVLTKEFVALFGNKKILQSKQWSWLQVDYPLIDIQEWLRSSVWQSKRNPLFVMYAALKFPYIFAMSFYEVFRNTSTSPSNPHIAYFPRPLYFAGCYFVKRDAAKILLDLATPVVYPADRLPNQARFKKGFHMLGVVPRLVRQDRQNLASDIGL